MSISNSVHRHHKHIGMSFLPLALSSSSLPILLFLLPAPFFHKAGRRLGMTCGQCLEWLRAWLVPWRRAGHAVWARLTVANVVIAGGMRHEQCVCVWVGGCTQLLRWRQVGHTVWAQEKSASVCGSPGRGVYSYTSVISLQGDIRHNNFYETMTC